MPTSKNTACGALKVAPTNGGRRLPRTRQEHWRFAKRELLAFGLAFARAFG